MGNKLNLRVYGIILSPNNEIVLSEETYKEFAFTKFPGGGLEWGEGTMDCLKREIQEEMTIEVDIDSLFYCTDFFQQSAFNPEDQIVSVYYFVKWNRSFELIFANNNKFIGNEGHSFRLCSMTDLDEESVLFPIDKQVVRLLKEKLK